MVALMNDLMDALKRDAELARQVFERFANGVSFANEFVSFRFQQCFFRRRWGAIEALQKALSQKAER